MSNQKFKEFSANKFGLKNYTKIENFSSDFHLNYET
jgi:hypothetical protein